MLGRERRQESIEIDGWLHTVGLWLRAEPELAANFRRFRAELVGLPILIDLLARLGVLPSAETILDAIVGRRRFGQVRRDPSQAVPSATLDMIHLGDRLELFEGDAGAVARERLHVGTYSSRPAAPAPIEHAHLGAGEQVVVLDLSRLPRRFVVGEVARKRVVDGMPLLGREDYDLAVLLPCAGDFDLTERTRRS